MNKAGVLFLCTHNSARSQMAEGLLRAMASDRFEVESAGTEKTSVHPLAIRALAEIGIDASDHTSKSADQFIDDEFDVVVTVCDSAAQDCPTWPGAKRIEHWPIEDPSWGPDDPATRFDRFVETRNELQRRIDELMETLSIAVAESGTSNRSDARTIRT